MKKLLAKLTDVVTFSLLTHPKLRHSHHFPRKGEFDYYLNEKFLVNPELFYTKPEIIPNIADSLTPVNERPYCHVYDFQFDSSITSPWRENNTVYGRYFKTTRSDNAPTVIVLHGWLAFNYVWYAGFCRKMAKLGIDSLITQLPYHIKRTPAASLYSGEYAISGDLTRSIEMIRQAVADVRSLLNWLKANSQGPVGIVGISLGGWIGAMTVVLESRLDFAVLMIPAVRPDDVMWHSKLCSPLKQDVEAGGVTYEELKELLKIITPKYFQSRLAPEKILLVEAEADQAVLSDTVEELREIWGRPAIRRYPHGHISIVFSHRVVNDILEFVQNVSQVRCV
jgi:dienelactone hydrolase